MSDSDNAKDVIITSDSSGVGITISEFGRSKKAFLNLSMSKEVETRSQEIQMVNPVTFPVLEIMVTRGYQELRRNYSTVTFLLSEAEKMAEEAKADALLDHYPEFIANKPKSSDNADTRKAFLSRYEPYSKALDRIDMLKATESYLDGKIKVMEKLSSFMKKQMDLIIRSGLSGSNLYVTSGGKK